MKSSASPLSSPSPPASGPARQYPPRPARFCAQHGMPQEHVCLCLVARPEAFQPVDDVSIQSHGHWLLFWSIKEASLRPAPVQHFWHILQIHIGVVHGGESRDVSTLFFCEPLHKSSSPAELPSAPKLGESLLRQLLQNSYVQQMQRPRPRAGRAISSCAVSRNVMAWGSSKTRTAVSNRILCRFRLSSFFCSSHSKRMPLHFLGQLLYIHLSIYPYRHASEPSYFILAFINCFCALSNSSPGSHSGIVSALAALSPRT